MENIPAIAASGFTADQISSLSDSALGGCVGITEGQMKNIPSTSYHGFTDRCVGVISDASFAGVQPTSCWMDR